jgi:chemotaxis protein methyltransferase CheR
MASETAVEWSLGGDIEDLTREDYELIRRLVYAKSGINLGDGKMQLVRARLGKKVRDGNFKSFRNYYRHVESDPSGESLCELLDAISTNTTHLFREIRHFNLLRTLVGQWAEDRTWRSRNSSLRIWSAACSSGEEPHSIAMVVHDVLSRHSGLDFKLLATDLSTRMLSRAKVGIYEAHRIGTVPPELRSRYFCKVNEDGQTMLQVIPDLRKRITFSHFNLMTPSFPFKQGFHVVFCRNVMIYFDRQTQEGLIGRIAAHMQPGAYLMIGHSESLNGIQHPLGYVEPTVYRKN